VSVHIFTFIGVPVSTSQGVIGAVLGIGIVKGGNTIHRRTLVNILTGWLLTPVLACLCVLTIFFLVHLYYIPPLRV